MAIIGVSFSRINIEKKEMVKGKINISNNIVIKDVKEKDLAPGRSIDQKGLQFFFSFASKYEPNVAEIALEGDVLFVGTNKQAGEIAAAWKKDKKVEKELMAAVLNTALAKCNIEALILSQQLNLPPPIPLPKISAKKA